MKKWNLPGTKTQQCFGWTVHSSQEPGEYLQYLTKQHPGGLNLLLKPPRGTTDSIWLYHHMRQLCYDLNLYLSKLHLVCTDQTCPSMTASVDTHFYCAGHPQPQPCTAMGYAVHTLDFASAQLTLGRSSRHFQSMVRRLYRIFAHVFFNHPQVFEEHRELYERFLGVARKYDLIQESLVTIPDTPVST